MTAAADTVDYLEPLTEADPILTVLCEAAGAMLDPAADFIGGDDGRPALAAVLDPATCPDRYLPWLAQWEGVVVRPEWSADELRDVLVNREHFRRGTVPGIEARVRRTLNDPNGYVRIVERYAGDPYQYAVVVKNAQVTGLTGDVIVTGIGRGGSRPVGHLALFVTIDGATWLDVPEGITWDDLPAGMTWDEFEI